MTLLPSVYNQSLKEEDHVPSNFPNHPHLNFLPFPARQLEPHTRKGRRSAQISNNSQYLAVHLQEISDPAEDDDHWVQGDAPAG